MINYFFLVFFMMFMPLFIHTMDEVQAFDIEKKIVSMLDSQPLSFVTRPRSIDITPNSNVINLPFAYIQKVDFLNNEKILLTQNVGYHSQSHLIDLCSAQAYGCLRPVMTVSNRVIKTNQEVDRLISIKTIHSCHTVEIKNRIQDASKLNTVPYQTQILPVFFEANENAHLCIQQSFLDVEDGEDIHDVGFSKIDKNAFYLNS